MGIHDNATPPTRTGRRRAKTAAIVVGAAGLTAFAATAAMKDRGLIVPVSATALSADAATPNSIRNETAAAEVPRLLQAAVETGPSSDGNRPDPDRLVSERPAPGPSASDRPATAVGPTMAVGDKVKLAFYERMAVEEDKWGRASSAMRGIVQRPELSGEYAVQDDGTISVPLLGAVPAAGRTQQQVGAALNETFEQFLGHKGMVSIVAMERAPIYVLGPVKNPGSYKFASGMTVLHAIAMAGGVDRGPNDAFSRIETVREIQKRSGAADALLRLIARVTVLKAERDGIAPKPPVQLVDMVGPAEARSLVDEQFERRKPIVAARKERQQAVNAAIESARQDLAYYGKTDTLDQLVKTRQERVDNTRALVERNVLAKASLLLVQAELTDAEQRRQDAVNQFGIVKQRLAAMEADGLKVQSDMKTDIATEIEMIERQISDNEREYNTSAGVLASLPSTGIQSVSTRQSAGVSYQIVRQTPAGPVSLDSAGMTVLQPGDLVNIAVAAADPSVRQPPAPDVRTPGGRAVKVRETGGRQAARD